jgi:hypothetical protein
MIYKERTFTRPLIDIPWHGAILTTDEHRTHLNTTYMVTGKIIFKEKIESNDGLSFTVKYVFDTTASLSEYESDPVIIAYANARRAYNTSMGIVESDKIVTSD